MTKKNNLPVVFLLLLSTVFDVAKLSGQDSVNTINKINISSPTAASLGKYGDIPVSYNSGIPQIGISIYTIKSKSLSLPISLSYHASGLKVQEMASWVGAGWSLNAGGMITRSVVGTPDDRGTTPANFLSGHYSDYGFDNYLFVPGTGIGSTTDGKVTDEKRFADGLKDGEPDLFFFNFGTYSGKFYFNDDRTPVLVPEQDVRIQTDYTLGPGFTGFIITTPDGASYHFGKSGNNGAIDPLETTIPQTMEEGEMGLQRAVSSWYLNKIISADGTDSILFTYQTENYAYYTLSMYATTGYQQPRFGPPSKYGYNLVKNLVDGVRLTQITFSNGSLSFIPSSTPRADLVKGRPTVINDGQPNTSSFSLGSIQISNAGGLCKKYTFDYSYSYDNVTPLQGPVLGSSSFSNIQTDRYKLRLDTLQEVSCDASIQIPPYIFNYYPELVPRTLNMGIDHWGYFNGVSNGETLIPEHIVKYQGEITEKPGANRESSWPAMRGGTLQKITYPTGGYNLFDYEANSVFVNYNTFDVVFRKSFSVGYNTTIDHSEELYAFSGDRYNLEISNALCNTMGCEQMNTTASVFIYNANNSIVFSSGAIASGQSKKFIIQIPPRAI